MALKVRENKDLAELFISLTGAKTLWEVWSDVIYLIAVELSNAFDTGERRAHREEQYIHIMSKYKPKERDVIVEIFCTIVNSLDQKPEQDLLGHLFMQLNLGNNRNGQFFSPYNLCELMARSVPSDTVRAQVEEKGYILINDPACGGGATLIAAANQMRSDGINFQQCCYFVGQDIDLMTALQCYIQLSLLGCAGYVKVGDTLSAPPTTTLPIELDENVWVMPLTYNRIWMERRIIHHFRLLAQKLPKKEVHEENAETPKRQKSEPVKKEEPPQLVLKDSGQFSFI